MTRAYVNLSLLLALLFCGFLILKGGRDVSRPNVQYMPDMAHSIAYEAFSANPNFPDGKTLQRPPAGTIPRGRLPLDFDGSKEDAARAGRELTSPVELDDPEILARGAFVFSAFCQQCHGPVGAGDGPVARRGFPPPPSLAAEKALKLPDGQLFHILTFGQGNMPAHAGQLSRGDRWAAVAHVRALQRDATAQPSATPAETQASEEAQQ